MPIVTSTTDKLGGDLHPLHGDGAGFEIDLPLAGKETASRRFLKGH